MSQMVQPPYFPIWISLFLITLFLFIKKYKAQKDPKLPPGPWKLPIIGNLHQFIGPLPHHILTNLAKKYGPIMHLKLGETSAIVISSPEAAKDVLKTHDIAFANRPKVVAAEIMFYNYLGFAFAPYGGYWRQMRKICVLELLSVKRVQSFSWIREEEVWNFVESISQSNGVPINLTKKIFSLTNDTTARAAFGNKCKDQDELLSLINEAMKLMGGFDISDLFPSLGFLGYVTWKIPTLRKSHGKLDKALENIMHDHKVRILNMADNNGKQGEEDIIDLLLKLTESSELEVEITTTHIKAVAMEIFFAGSGVSSTTIEWAMSELLRNPRVMKKAQAEVRQALEGKKRVEEKDIQKLDYLKSVIKETLRLHPPATLIPRETREQCEVGGYVLPTKTKVLINAWAIGRDPTHWIEADSFKPERFLGSSMDFKGTNFEFLPFGGGRRVCPGMSFGVASVELVLSQLLYHFDWKLENGQRPEELDAFESFGLSCQRKNNLRLIPTVCIPFFRGHEII